MGSLRRPTTSRCWGLCGSSLHHSSSSKHRRQEREQVPINLICPPLEAKVTLDELVNQWANEEEGQYLYGAPDCLIFHIQRFQCQENMWTKHHRQLEVPTVITVPFCNDGVSISKAGYRTVAMILHHGKTHHSGHFTAIHALENAFWSVDDNQYPQPIGGLNEQQESEALQVWLVHDPMEDDSDDNLIPEPVIKKSKTHYEDVLFCFANVTSFGKKVQDWVWSKADHLIFLQETHLSDSKLQEVMQYFIARGWRALGVPAMATGRGGNTGGFLCLHPPHHHVHSLQHFCKEGNGWMAVGYQRDGLHMAIIQLYLRTGETLQSPLNAEILSNLFGFLEILKAPFIIGGDWQNPPSELAAMVAQSKFKAHILAGEGPTTLQGSEIDYFLVSNTLHGSLKLELTWEVPWRPHCALNLKYHSEHLAIPVQQMRAFPPIGKALNPQHGWSEFQEPNGPFYILNYQITGLSADLARWCAKSESYLTQQIQQPRRGRGCQVEFYTGPLAGPHPAQLWKKDDQPFGRKCQSGSVSYITVPMKLLNRTFSTCSPAFQNMLQMIWARTISAPPFRSGLSTLIKILSPAGSDHGARASSPHWPRPSKF